VHIFNFLFVFISPIDEKIKMSFTVNRIYDLSKSGDDYESVVFL